MGVTKECSKTATWRGTKSDMDARIDSRISTRASGSPTARPANVLSCRQLRDTYVCISGFRVDTISIISIDARTLTSVAARLPRGNALPCTLLLQTARKSMHTRRRKSIDVVGARRGSARLLALGRPRHACAYAAFGGSRPQGSAHSRC